MARILLIIVVIVLIYALCRAMYPTYKKSYIVINSCGSDEEPQDIENRTLNDIESSSYRVREPVYDDTYRINNRMFWMSDYSQPGQDTKPSLNDDVITPIRAVSGADAIKYLSGVHNVSRFGSEKSI